MEKESEGGNVKKRKFPGLPWWLSKLGSGIVTAMAWVTAAVWVGSPAQKFLYAVGTAKKEKKKNLCESNAVMVLTDRKFRTCISKEKAKEEGREPQ